ncbi:MAG: bifunctional serine/threonine-protein kinase/formylglycine-generating enzyme family protein [Polycyclovorans sp.]|nr:bifunctional serine/threonine-protein kinase/formylglycine-generating enzyme family protein [Polycyclovorans sp.]
MCAICGYDESQPRASMFLRHGVILDGKYRVGRVLGRPGGFGITYLAWDIPLQQRVAIKEYLPRALANRDTDTLTVSVHTADERATFEAGREQFLREARIVAGLDHPNIVRVRGYFNANGTAYLVMDYYEGISVGDYLATVSPTMEPALAVGIIEPVLEGLAFVHQHGVVHRDIKPHNLYLAAVGKPILLDFGAARRAVGDVAHSLSVVLSEGYAPLEQYQRRAEQGPQTDVYGMAATLLRMITGQAPPMALDRLNDDALDGPGWAALPPSLQAVLRRALAVDAADRHPTAEALLSDLRAWRATVAPPGPAPAAAASAPRPGPATPPPQPQPAAHAPHASTRGRALRPGPWMLGLVTVILLLGWAARSQFPASAPGDPALSDTRAAEAADEADEANTARTAPAPTSGPTPASARAGAGASSAPIRTELSRSALIDLPMIRIPAQNLSLGGADGLAATPVRLNAYDISAHEVTVEAFAQFVADQQYDNPNWDRYPCDGVLQGDWSSSAVATTQRVPVVCVNVEDARAFAAWRSAVSGDHHRLPTEAEWEAAARAGRRSAYWWGDTLDTGRANCAGCPPFTSRAANVGRYPANPLGLYDTAGNVREWTCSAAADDRVRHACSDADLATLKLRFVVRGGSWHQPASAMRSSARDQLEPLRRDHHTGFRLVRQALQP